MKISSNFLALFVRSKFYLRQMISIACGVAIGVFLSLLLAPLLDRMCMFDGRFISKSLPSRRHHSSSSNDTSSKTQYSHVVIPLPSSSQPQQQVQITAKNRPHFLSHELGIRNKLLSVTLISSHNDLQLVETLYHNLYHGSESTTVPFSVVSILSGQQSLISSLEHEIKANLSNFLTMRLADQQLTVNSNVGGQYIDDQGQQQQSEDAAYTRHLTHLVTETLYKVAEQYRTQFDWFAIAFPQVYVRFDKLYDELMMMSPTYDRLLMVPQIIESGYNCDNNNNHLSRRPFKSILLSNKLMNDVFAAFESTALCPKDTSLRFESLDCLDVIFKHACIPTYGHDVDRFQVANFPNDPSLLPSIANAWAVYPIVNVAQYRTLNKLFLENDYNTSLAELGLVREELANLVGRLPLGENKASWPIDVQPPLKPKQRFDIAPWQFINSSHVFFTDEYTTVQALAGPDLEDVQGVTAAACAFIEKNHPKMFKFLSLESGYRKFDPVRGMEYLLYLLFESNNERVLKFMHVLKPLNRLEPINAPHVTEDAVITLVVPVFVDDSDEAEETGVAFLEQVLSLLKVGDRLKLWMLLVYPSSTTAVDPFMKLKSLVADGESQFPGRLAWLSVQTSHRSSLHLFEAVVRSRQNNGKENEEWLVLMLPPESLLSREFLNRVRLMAIRRYQVYFPIAFSQYHPSLIAEPLLLSAINGATSPSPTQAGASASTPTTTTTSESSNVVELTSRHGHFDQFDFDTAAFYLSDYSECRRTSSGQNKEDKRAPVDVADVFLACTQLHVFRAVDPGLKRLYRQSTTSCDTFTSSDQALESCRSRLEIGLGNRKHMAAKLSEHVQSAASVAPEKLDEAAPDPAVPPAKNNVPAQKIVDEERDYEDHNGDLLNINGG